MYKLRGLHGTMTNRFPLLLSKKDQAKYKMLKGDLYQRPYFRDELYQCDSYIEHKFERYRSTFSYIIPLINLQLLCYRYEYKKKKAGQYSFREQDSSICSVHKESMCLVEVLLNDFSDLECKLTKGYSELCECIHDEAYNIVGTGNILFKDGSIAVYRGEYNGVRDLIVGVSGEEVLFFFGLYTNLRYDAPLNNFEIDGNNSYLEFIFTLGDNDKYILTVNRDNFEVDYNSEWIFNGSI